MFNLLVIVIGRRFLRDKRSRQLLGDSVLIAMTIHICRPAWVRFGQALPIQRPISSYRSHRITVASGACEVNRLNDPNNPCSHHQNTPIEFSRIDILAIPR